MSATAIKKYCTNMLKTMNYINVYSPTKMRLLKALTCIFNYADF